MFERSRQDLVRRLRALSLRYQVISARAHERSAKASFAIRLGLGGSTEIFNEIEAKALEKGELRLARRMLLMMLGDLSKELPESLVAEIQACDDLDRLQAAVHRTRMLTSLDQFQL